SSAEAFRQALAVDPHDPAATRFLAMTAEKDGDRTLAVQLAHRFIAHEPPSRMKDTLCGAAPSPTCPWPPPTGYWASRTCTSIPRPWRNWHAPTCRTH